MRILMTGATGMIGREVAKRLAGMGHELVIVSRNTARAQQTLPFVSRAYEWAGGEASFPQPALEGVEAVINLAGESIGDVPWSAARKAAIRDSRVLGTHSLVQAMRQMAMPARVLVQGSAIGVYGDRGEEKLSEAAAPGQGFLAEVVRDWEAEADVLNTTGVRVVKLRTGVVLARGEGALKKLTAIFGLGLGGRLASGQQWMSWIHLDDIVNATIFSLENEALRGPVNAVAPEPVRNVQFTVALARALRRPAVFPVPRLALQLVLGDASEMLLSSQCVIPQALTDAKFAFKFKDLESALAEVVGK